MRQIGQTSYETIRDANGGVLEKVLMSHRGTIVVLSFVLSEKVLWAFLRRVYLKYDNEARIDLPARS